MGTYDLKRLEVAIQYIRRMAEGRNPVTNRPAPENEILTNGNVNRCLLFVGEILAEVKSTGGVVGNAPKASKAPRPGVAQTFPYEILRGFRYVEDKQISYFLRQLGSLMPEGQEMPVRATMVTNWLRENGYLEKRMMKESGKENSVPTQAGEALGLYTEKAGAYPNEYYRVYYNEQAQRFLVENFEKILTESEALSNKKRSERKQQNGGSTQNPSTGSQGRTDTVSVYSDGAERSRRRRSATPLEDDPAFASLLASAPSSQNAGSSTPFEDDPAFASLLASAPAPQDDGFGSGGFGEVSDFMGEGWESADEGLPW